MARSRDAKSFFSLTSIYPHDPAGTILRSKPRPNSEYAIMCGYVLFVNLCRCYGAIICDTSCERDTQELNRINHAAAWRPSTINQLPFHQSDECLPGWHNTRLVSTQRYCCLHATCDGPSNNNQGKDHTSANSSSRRNGR